MFPTFSCSARFMSWSTTRPETWAVEGLRDSRRRRRFATFEIVNGRPALFIPLFFRITAGNSMQHTPDCDSGREKTASLCDAEKVSALP
jgi:hypothetical protein